MIRVPLVLCWGWLFFAPFVAANDLGVEQEDAQRAIQSLLEPHDWGTESRGPLCGIYASCRALRLVGIDCSEQDFLKHDFVSSCGGSTTANIRDMVVNAGGQAIARGRLSVYDLKAAGVPMIANVRRSPIDDRFNHWIAVVPGDDGLTVFDSNDAPTRLTYAQFMGIWSGVGVFVSQPGKPISLMVWLGRSSLFIGAFALSFSLLFVLRALGLRVSTFNEKLRTLNPGKQVATIVTCALACMCAGVFIFGDPLNYRAGVQAATAHLQHGFEFGTLADIKAASEDADVLLVDARREVDFEYGTVAGAVNIPVTASAWEITDYVEKLPKDLPIVVFCQSGGCSFDETIGRQLAVCGFTNITVADAGWREYREQLREF